MGFRRHSGKFIRSSRNVSACKLLKIASKGSFSCFPFLNENFFHCRRWTNSVKTGFKHLFLFIPRWGSFISLRLNLKLYLSCTKTLSRQANAWKSFYVTCCSEPCLRTRWLPDSGKSPVFLANLTPSGRQDIRKRFVSASIARELVLEGNELLWFMSQPKTEFTFARL